MLTIVRELCAAVHARQPKGVSIAILFTFSPWLAAAQPVHLLGFVERLCDVEPYCFELEVKPEFRDAVGARVRVRFADVETIYDPENYVLTLAQQKISAGSHLRLLMQRDPAGQPGDYSATIIWIGD